MTDIFDNLNSRSMLSLTDWALARHIQKQRYRYTHPRLIFVPVQRLGDIIHPFNYNQDSSHLPDDHHSSSIEPFNDEHYNRDHINNTHNHIVNSGTNRVGRVPGRHRCRDAHGRFTECYTEEP